MTGKTQNKKYEQKNPRPQNILQDKKKMSGGDIIVIKLPHPREIIKKHFHQIIFQKTTNNGNNREQIVLKIEAIKKIPVK